MYRLKRSPNLFIFLLSCFVFFMFSVLLEAQERSCATPPHEGGAESSGLTFASTIKIILVQFNDVKWNGWTDTQGQWNEYLTWHYKSDFDSLFVGPYSGFNSDQDQVFGSVRDYFIENSRSQHFLDAEVLNPVAANGYPDWVNLPNNKSSYSTSNFLTAARSAAQSQLGITITATSDTVYCYIYAGNMSQTILDYVPYVGAKEMVVAHRRTWPRFQEHVGAKMAHIGYPVHEFTHTAGAGHTDAGHWGLMQGGHNNGSVWSNAPSTMNPWHLNQAGWASINYVAAPTNASLTYSTSPTTHSTFYARDLSSEKIIIENRRYSNTFDAYVPGAQNADVNGYTNDGGLLIWRARGNGLPDNYTAIIPADAEVKWGNDPDAVTDMFLPRYYPDSTIHDDSSPGNLRKYDGSKSYFGITGYFATGTTININFETNYDAPPAAPQNLVITNPGQNGQYIALAWDANTELDFDHYGIYRGVQDDKFSPIDWSSSPVATTSNTSWTDPLYKHDATSPSFIHYRITAFDAAGNESGYSNTVSAKGEPPFKAMAPTMPDMIPEEFALHQNYPNPFNPSTVISYSLPVETSVQITIINPLGKAINTLFFENQQAGKHRFHWNGRDAHGRLTPSGVYLYRLEEISSISGEKFVAVKKMILMR